MKRSLLLHILLFTSLTVPAQTAGDYRSAGSGNWDDAGVWLRFDGSDFVTATSSPVSSDGVITIAAGSTITVRFNVLTDQTVVEVGAALIQNADIGLADGPGDDLIVNGTWSWNRNVVNNPGTALVGVDGTLNIATGNVHYMFSSIVNNGTIDWQGGDIYFGNNAVLTNNGTMVINSDNSAQNNNSQGAVANYGTITKLSTGTTTFIANNGFTNEGTVNCSAGVFNFHGTFTNTGILSFNGGTFNISSSGTFHQNSGGSMAGTGSFTNAGTLNLNIDQTFGASLQFGNTGNVNGAGNLSIGHAFTFSGNMSGAGALLINNIGNWNGGEIARVTTIAAGGTLNIATGNVHYMFSSIVNNGTIDWQGGDIYFGNNPVLTNNGTMVINSDNSALNNNSQGAVANYGTITKLSTGTTTFIVNNGFTNEGTVNCSAGTLSFSGTFNSGGVLKGAGIISMNATFASNGIIAPGNSSGILTFNGRQPLSANSNLQIEILDASGAGIGHDQLARNGNLTLGGTLTVTETGSAPDGTYIVINLTTGSIKGAFSNVNIPAGYQIVVNSNHVLLVKGGGPVNPPLPGSGNALSFDGIDDVMEIPNIAFDDFTYELWIKTIQVGPGTGGPAFGGIGILSSDNGNSNTGDFTPIALNGNVISFGTGDPEITLTSTMPINDNKWHHVAVTRDKTLLVKKIFIDGVENASGSCSNLSYNINPNIYVGADFVDQIFFQGRLDEIRIWNTALTESQIRDRMCRKIKPDDALYSSLVGYYNFDESVGITVFDGSDNANHATFFRNFSAASSGAPIGNSSSHDYLNATKTTSLSHTGGESFSVTSTSGSPDGVHVYRVDELPNTLSGTSGVGTNNKYFGVFQVGGTAPEYTAVYNYNPSAGTEGDFRLFKRDNNSATSWAPLSELPDQAANAITITGHSTEYILGSVGSPLPLNLLSFTGSSEEQKHILRWNTARESNTGYFQLEQGRDARSFAKIGIVPAEGSGNNSYYFVHEMAGAASYYYRLKMVDQDGSYAYSRIIKVLADSDSPVYRYPNPVSQTLTVNVLEDAGQVRIMTREGKVLGQQMVTGGSAKLDLRNYSPGVYILQYNFEGGVINKKVVKN